MTNFKIEPDELYYLQDNRNYVGNSVLWWAIDSKGYVCDIREAHVFKGRELSGNRDTDIPWPKSLIDGLIKHHVDMQTLPRRDRSKGGK